MTDISVTLLTASLGVLPRGAQDTQTQKMTQKGKTKTKNSMNGLTLFVFITLEGYK